MILSNAIEELKNRYPECQCINIYYHADLKNNNSGEILPHEFVGVASYHDNYFDTSEDPDGWLLEDEIQEYVILENKNNIISIDVDLGMWDTI